MNHLEFAAIESAALEPTTNELWLVKVENLMGHSLDGDQQIDGYSLDYCLDLCYEGKTPAEAVKIITANKLHV